MNDFVRRVLQLIASHDLYDEVHWRFDRDGTINFYVVCNDLFWWACADTEDLIEESLPILEQAIADCKQADPVAGEVYAPALYCCRMRKMRPQGAAYPDGGGAGALWPLFDVCGPPREVGLGNPRPRPDDNPGS